MKLVWRSLRRLSGLRGWCRVCSMQSINGLLLLLVLLFAVAMWVLSSLNLGYSQRALADLRSTQIDGVFRSGLQQIIARQQQLQLYTEGVSRIGEIYSQGQGPDLAPRLERELATILGDFSGATGVGIWYLGGALPSSGERYTPYRFHQADGSIGRLSGSRGDGTGHPDYHRQLWFDLALSEQWQAQAAAGQRFFWTPTYYNPLSDSAVVTVVSPVYDAKRRLIGLATTDWEAEQIIDLVSRVEVTPGSFSYLIDSNGRKLSSLSRSDDPLHAQHLLDALLSVERPDYSVPLAGEAPAFEPHLLQVDGRDYVLYFAGTPAGMLFGVGVPQDEIDAVLRPMRDTNYRILGIMALVMLLLCGYLVYRITGLVRELRASYTDELTGLPNRTRLLQDLQQSQDGTLMLINLDRFREINSLFGHACGDQVVRTLSERIGEFLATQEVYSSARVYRQPGAEFALLGPYVPTGQLIPVLRRLGSFLQAQTLAWQEQEVSVGVTIGVASRQQTATAEPQDNLLSQATLALRQARKQAHNYQIYDAGLGMEARYEQNLLWARRIKEAFLEDRFEPWFQPIRDNATGRVVKYECLIRMRDADGKVASPGMFLDVVRQLRLGRQITRIVVDKCFALFRDQPGDFSINLSYADILDAELTAHICEQLRESGIGPKVIFEILESDGIEKYSEIRRFIERVKSFGCRIAIDDFGTGYSNFEHLLQMNVDLIKIDGSLIRHLHEDQTAYLVTQGIVQFARSLSIATVAEFVHCAEVQERVQALGINFSQGEYIGMPAPAPGSVR